MTGIRHNVHVYASMNLSPSSRKKALTGVQRYNSHSRPWRTRQVFPFEIFLQCRTWCSMQGGDKR